LRTFLPVLDRRWACTLRDRLALLGDRLSEARDLDVLVQAVERRTEDLSPALFVRAGPLLHHLRAECREKRACVRDTFRDPACDALLRDVTAAGQAPVWDESERKPEGDEIRVVLAAVWKRALRSVRAFGKSPTDARLHRIRIRAKHVRCAAECFTPVAGKPAAALARYAERLQTVLGEQHDATIAAERLCELSRDPKMAAVAQELARMSSERAARGRRHWRRSWRKMRESYRRLD
jgi:CHAD domain-containing protein